MTSFHSRNLSISALGLLACALFAQACGDEDSAVGAPIPGGNGGDGDGDFTPGGDGDVSSGDGDGFPGDGDGDGPGNGLGCNKMDLVFVVDNSGSMSEEQAMLAQSFPKMIDVLRTFRSGALDFRIGITTTAFPFEILGGSFGSAEAGAFLKLSGMSEPWLNGADPELAQRFSQLAMVGTGGSGFEQPLRAALWSVDARDTDGTNKSASGSSFRRPDSLLAVVLITDEDDGSVKPGGFLPEDLPVSDIVSGFDALTGDRSRWATAVIAGEKDCRSSLGDAFEGVRLKDFVQKTGKNAIFSDICSGDLEGALQRALDKFASACNDIVLY